MTDKEIIETIKGWQAAAESTAKTLLKSKMPNAANCSTSQMFAYKICAELIEKRENETA